MLHLTLTPSNTPLSFLSSKKQYDETSFNLKLVSFQEEQNFSVMQEKAVSMEKALMGTLMEIP